MGFPAAKQAQFQEQDDSIKRWVVCHEDTTMNGAGPVLNEAPPGTESGQEYSEATRKAEVGPGGVTGMDFPRWASRYGCALSPLEGSRIAVPETQGVSSRVGAAGEPPPGPRSSSQPRPHPKAAARQGPLVST